MNKKVISHISSLITLIIIIASIAPIIYYGKDSIITIHDNLDSNLARIKMLKDSGLLMAFNQPTGVLGNMSTIYLGQSYHITTLIYSIFDIFTAYVTIYVLKILIGFGSMFLLLTKLFPGERNSSVLKLVSVGFALTPLMLGWWIDSAPLLCYFFIIIKDLKTIRLDKRIFLLLLYPAISDFALTGFFLLALWLLGIIILWIKEKKFNLSLAVGLLCLTAGYILSNLKLFYYMLFLATPTNRELHVNMPLASLKQGLKNALKYFADGHYHAPSMALKVIIPVGAITLISVIVFLFCKNVKNSYKEQYNNFAVYSFVSIILIGIIGFFSVLGGIYDTEYKNIINAIFPFLSGFNWGRFWQFNRIVFYIWFAYTLILFLKIKKIRFLAYTFAILQIAVILTSPVLYNYAALNLNHDKMVRQDDMLTYNEFFAEDLFEKIKSDLNYNGEGVAAVGYHPSVLMYNGFSCVDGYISSFPLSRAIEFREIIEPQLNYNESTRLYYDQWAARMYLYCDEAPYEPTRKRITSPVTIRINTEAFKKLDGVYILSRGEIENAKELGLNFINSYTDRSYIYDIFIYLAV
ncbi:MAG: DUF6044 family protein [Eubacterium sp.]|nr:DUF6044 family protein [Eubacterium sp.]